MAAVVLCTSRLLDQFSGYSGPVGGPVWACAGICGRHMWYLQLLNSNYEITQWHIWLILSNLRISVYAEVIQARNIHILSVAVTVQSNSRMIARFTSSLIYHGSWDQLVLMAVIQWCESLSKGCGCDISNIYCMWLRYLTLVCAACCWFHNACSM
jgi:hypothetical protein